MINKDKLILDTAKKYYSEDIKCYDAFLHGVEFAESLFSCTDAEMWEWYVEK